MDSYRFLTRMLHSSFELIIKCGDAANPNFCLQVR